MIAIKFFFEAVEKLSTTKEYIQSLETWVDYMHILIKYVFHDIMLIRYCVGWRCKNNSEHGDYSTLG